MDRARREVIGKYKNADEVRATLQRLERDGYAREDVTLYTNNSNVRAYENDYEVDMLTDETRHLEKSEENKSFWDQIKDIVSYKDSDIVEMNEYEQELLAPYREDIDNGYTIIVVREDVKAMDHSTKSNQKDNLTNPDRSIPEADSKYNQHEETTTVAPGDFNETDMQEKTNDFITRDKYIEHEHIERLELNSEESTDSGDTQNKDMAPLEGDSSTELNLDKEMEEGSTDQIVDEGSDEPDSVLDRDFTNKEDTLFDDPTHLNTEENDFNDQESSDFSNEVNSRERIDPNKDIKYDPTHQDMDL